MIFLSCSWRSLNFFIGFFFIYLNLRSRGLFVCRDHILFDFFNLRDFYLWKLFLILYDNLLNLRDINWNLSLRLRLLSAKMIIHGTLLPNHLSNWSSIWSVDINLTIFQLTFEINFLINRFNIINFNLLLRLFILLRLLRCLFHSIQVSFEFNCLVYWLYGRDFFLLGRLFLSWIYRIFLFIKFTLEFQRFYHCIYLRHFFSRLLW